MCFSNGYPIFFVVDRPRVFIPVRQNGATGCVDALGTLLSRVDFEHRGVLGSRPTAQLGKSCSTTCTHTSTPEWCYGMCLSDTLDTSTI